MDALEIICHEELCDLHAVELLVSFLGLEKSKSLLSSEIDQQGMADSFLEFIDSSTSPVTSEDNGFENGLTEEDKEFLRELEAFEIEGEAEGEADAAANPQSFEPDEFDLLQLADTYLREAVSLSCFSFCTGNDEEDKANYLMNRFLKVAACLPTEKRQSVIDTVDHHKEHTTGDVWQVFKYVCRPGLWSTPAKMDAVHRVADSIEDPMSPEQEEQFGVDFLQTIREIKKDRQLSDQQNWKGDGF
ncbi:hypothetical protein FYK55_27325 [Roseiconus nitratireducens]|uniref:Uncharacterized protein n=1 Tax=Roseiconus nitratireducens TaxID=2605748 RepID=A0A5M6CTQ9_9BACT|nr:hypothetical protein [Roseiconus nitratireducens]KAA5538601.1 hypothetical protein FYK55_27325 [Roseiconus nitratireducens]